MQSPWRRTFPTWVMVLALSLAVLIAKPPVYPDYPVRAVSEYQVNTAQAGLAIALDPLEDAKEQKTYFKTEFRSKGFVPVFVVLHNQSASESFLVRKEEITYAAARLGLTTPVQGSKAGQGVALAGALAISTPALIIGLKMIAKSTEVQQNIFKKELRTVTLSPGAKAHGFLFIPADKGSSTREKIRLRVPVTRIGSEETLNFDLIF